MADELEQAVERVARAMYDAWPHTVISQTLAERTGQPVGSVLSWDVALAMGADMGGLLRLASACVPLIAQARTEAAERAARIAEEYPHSASKPIGESIAKRIREDARHG